MKISEIIVFSQFFHLAKRKPLKQGGHMLKLRPIGKVNKGPSALWWPNFENVKKQKMGLITILIIPENMNPPSPCIETQWSFVKFVKILKNWLFWSFFCYNFGTRPKKSKIFAFPEQLYISRPGTRGISKTLVTYCDHIDYLKLSNCLKKF